MFEDKWAEEPTETPEDLVFADVSNVSSDVSGEGSELCSWMETLY